MKATAFGPALVESGKNKGAARHLSFATGIKPENSNGLPVDNGTVYLNISPASITVGEFESRGEVEQYAGEHFDGFVVDAANAMWKSTTRSKITAEARKLSLPPTDIRGWIGSLVDKITASSLFVPTVSAAGKVAVADIVALGNDTSLTAEQKLAAILALANR